MTKNSSKSRSEPSLKTYQFFNLHELAAACAIGAVTFLVIAWREGDGLYWALSAACAVAAPVAIVMARRIGRDRS